MAITFTRMFNILYHLDFILNLTTSARDLRDVINKMKTFTGTVVVRDQREAYQRRRREEYVDNDQGTRKNFLLQLIELSEEGSNFTDDKLREEVDTFMMVVGKGHHDIRLVMLGMFPDVQEKVYHEVLDVLGRRRFHYMEKVMRATMRIFPIRPLLVRAITKDIHLENCVIPAGSSVVMVIIQTHWNEKLWSQPFKFDHDRFLPEEMAKRHLHAWLPLSGGPRPKYAFMAMKALIATVVRRCKFSTDYKRIQDIKLKADLMLKPVNGYSVSVEFKE